MFRGLSSRYARQYWLLTTIVSWLSLLSCGIILVRTTTLPSDLLRAFSPHERPLSSVFLITAVVYNRKSIPIYWHVRFLGSFIYEAFLKPHSLPEGVVWQTTVRTGLYSPFGECDILGHKSNSTYFADLDIARTQHFCRLMNHGIRSRHVIQLAARATLQQALDGEADAVQSRAPGGIGFALGGVATHFHREIKPYERFDIHTRILDGEPLYGA